jgi:histidinol phosphatase-like enzyme (inositol monophosphatase family)
VGEEFGNEREDADWVWVLDPIDGTKAFISGQPTFGTLVALLHQAEPVVGVIDQPISGERWSGARGLPTTFNGEATRTRAAGELASATLYATSPDQFRGLDEAAFAGLSVACGLTRFGLDCYAYGLLALGFVDLVVEADMKLYDFAALVPVVEGAGGVISDWGGRPLGAESDGRVAAAGDARLHRAALGLLGATA